MGKLINHIHIKNLLEFYKMIHNILALPGRFLAVLPITEEQKKVVAVYMREAAERVNE